MNAFPAFALSGALALLGLTACTHESALTPPDALEPIVDSTNGVIVFPTNAPQLNAISVEAAKPATASTTRVTGRLAWDDDVTVGIFTPVAGRITKVLAKVGETVKAGAPLAEIDSPDFGQALANARTAEGNLAAADKAFRRSRELLQHGAGAQKDVDAAQAAYVAAKAERDRASWVLSNYGGSEKNTNAVYILRTPLAGTVVERNVNPGQELRADSMLANAPNLAAPHFVVSDPTKLWVQLDIAESDIASFQAGQQLRIYSPAFPWTEFAGHLDTTGEALDPSSHTLKARGTVDNPEKLLRAEMYVTVEMTRPAARKGVEISSAAAFLKGDKHYVFVETHPGEFKREEISVGTESDDRVLVQNGLTNGEPIVTDGSLFLEQLFE